MDLTVTTYKDQQNERRSEYFNCDGAFAESLIEVYDEGVKNTEEIYDERLRNKTSVLINLVSLLRNADDIKSNINDKTMHNTKENIYKTMEKCINDIINIKNC